MSVSLAYDIHGRADAPWLLLGSSLGATGEMWDPQLPALAERFRVLRYTHRGHGGSPAPPGPYSIDDLGGDVLALVDALGIGEFAYCGLSLGGMVGMWLAARVPDRLSRLALCCTSAHFDTNDVWIARAAAARAEGTAAIAPAVVTRWFTLAFAESHPDVVDRCVGWVSSADDEGYAACCDALAALDLRAELASVSAPTLVVAGADDLATPVEYAHRIADAIPGARIEVIDAAAHLANLEAPDRVTALLLAHLGASNGQ